MPSSRAKYQCNEKLAEYIKLANIIPADFDFQWSIADAEGGDSKFYEWLGKLTELSKKQIARLLVAKIDNIELLLPEGFPTEDTKQEAIKYAGILLIQFLRIKHIRDFLRSLIRLNELSQDKHIKALITNEDIFPSLNRLHSNTKKLFKLPAVQKVYKTLKDTFVNIDETKMMGLAVQFTSHFIRFNETKVFNLSDDEISEFLLHFTVSLGDKIDDSDNPRNTLQKFDLLAQTLFEIERNLLATNVTVNQDGNVNFELNEFAKSLQGVNISRIRLCEYCSKIFWANRKDTFTCSKSHARNRRMRLLRQNWKDNGDKYLEARKKKAAKKEK